MTPQRKKQLRTEYLKLAHRYDQIMDGYSCGRELAEHLNPELWRLRQGIEAIQAEVRIAMGVA